MCQRQIGEQIFSYKGGWVPNMLGETPLYPKPWNPGQHPAQFGETKLTNPVPIIFPLASKACSPSR